LTPTGVLSDDLALTSDDMKYPSVAVGENADWHGILPQEPEHGVCLQNIIFFTNFYKWLNY